MTGRTVLDRREPASPQAEAREERELEGREDAIRTAETAVAEIQAVFSDPDFHRKHGRELPALDGQLAAAEAEVDRLHARRDELLRIAGPPAP